MANDIENGERRSVQLRRYPNRRYYDAARSQHLTLEEIFRLIAEGHSVQVNDSKSGEDITTRVLAQLILEQAPGKWAALPAELLHQIIRANESLLREFVEKYFLGALTAFEKSQRDFDQYLRQAMGLSHELISMNPAGAWSSNWTAMMLGPYMRALVGEHPAPALSEPTEHDRTHQNRESAELKATIDELKHQIEQLRMEMRKQ